MPLPTRLLASAATLACGLLGTSTANANNTFFLPGDAFFYAYINAFDVKQLGRTPKPELKYGRPRNGGYFCGYAGYSRLQLPKLTLGMKRSIGKAFQLLKADLEKDTNGVPHMALFVYNADYDWRKWGLALQYNENWVQQTARFGHSPRHMRLEAFVETPASLMAAWRDAPAVKPLRVQLPELPERFRGAWSKSPLIASEDVQLLAMPTRDFRAYYEKRQAGLRVLQITRTKGVTAYQLQGRAWRAGGSAVSPKNLPRKPSPKAIKPAKPANQPPAGKPLG